MRTDYSQGLPTPSLGLLAALSQTSLVQLKASEVERVRKWVEGPSPLKRAQGFMKSAFHQISEGRAEAAAKLVISAAVLAGFGYKENPGLASRIIETARRVVHHALAAKTGAAGLGFWFLPTKSKEQAYEASMRLAVNVGRGTMTGEKKLRPVQALPFEHEGQPGILFQDPASIAVAKGILARRGIPTAGPGIFVSPEEEAGAEYAFAKEWPEFFKSTVRAYAETLKRPEPAVADLFALYPHRQFDSKGTMWALLGAVPRERMVEKIRQYADFVKADLKEPGHREAAREWLEHISKLARRAQKGLAGALGMNPVELLLTRWRGEETENLTRARATGDRKRVKEHLDMLQWINTEIQKIRDDERRSGSARLIDPWTGEPK